MNKKAPLTTALVLGMTVMAIPPLAIAHPTSAEIAATAQLVARGAAVIVSVAITCDDSTFPANLSVRVTQRAGQSVLVGFGGISDQPCNSTPRTIELLVTAGQDQKKRVFRKGLAAVEASLFACDTDGTCSGISDAKEITIVIK